MSVKRWTATVLVAVMMAASLAAQGSQTGVLSGFVRDVDGLPLPGAVVTLSSPSLQGTRSTVADERGAYVVRGLPPGDYAVTFVFAEMKPETGRVTISIGVTTEMDALIRTVTATESVVVTAAIPTVLSTPAATAHTSAREADQLPIGRTPAIAAELAPGLTNNTPNANQVTINGAFAFDNVFMIDGVDINDNLIGNPDNLFIEEAVDQTQVITSALSAEYGRFSGGVINLVTKRGGDLFSGSLRTNLSNPAWTDETPFEKDRNQTRLDVMDRYHEGVLGGPIQRKKVWFFVAGRTQSTTQDLTLAETGAEFIAKEDAHRWEGKITATPWANQTFQGQYTRRHQSGVRQSTPITIDPNAGDSVDQPGSLFVTNWNGVVASRFFATAQYSQKQNHPRFGNTSTDIIDSPYLTIGRVVPPGQKHFNAPYFDRNDPEDRDNYQVTGSVAWLASSPRWGTHDLKTGAEHFVAIGRGGNSQSSTGFIFNTDYLTAGGRPVIDQAGRLIPVWIPGSTSQAETIPTRGAELRIKTTSLYVQDRWVALPRLTLDLGLRFEHARSDATGDIQSVNTSAWMPRLAATFDVDGSGTVAGASYSIYSGKYVQNYINRNTAVGNPARVTRTYNGPAGEGRDFAPAFDPANYTVTSGSFPTANVFFDDDLSSASTREITLWAGRGFVRGNVRATYVWRNTSNFIETFTDTPGAAGRTDVTYNGRSYGVFDNVYYRNSDGPVREYQAVVVQGDYRPMPRVTVGGHWTLQLRNHGNFEGESPNSPGIGSIFGDYPEIIVNERTNPEGRLDDYQRHKLRVWTIVNVGLGRFGALDIAPLWRYNSALTYSLTANVPLTAEQRAADPGYTRIPTSQTIYFGERGSQEFAGYGLLDLAATYEVPVWQRLRPWVKFEVLNVLDNDKLIAWNTAVTPDPNSPRDQYGLPTGYLQGSSFGQATATTHYARPRPGMTGGRTFLGAIGLRF